MNGRARRLAASLGCVVLLGLLPPAAGAAPAGNTACAASETATKSIAFLTPTVAVNPFNRTQDLNDVYVAVPGYAGADERPGHLEKFRLRADGAIVDRNGIPVVDATTGSMRPDARGLWFDPGGSGRGAGAVGEDDRETSGPSPASFYTDVTLGALARPGNTVASANAALTPRLLGLASGDTAGRTRLIDAALGAGGAGAVRSATVATVVYGGTPARPTVEDAVVLVVTDDGRLHALDAPTGRELWSFLPISLLSALNRRHTGPQATAVSGGPGGQLRVYRVDAKGQGIVDRATGDRVYLLYAVGRGGSGYYGFDITIKSSPVLLWRHGPADLPFAGGTRSTPAIARVRIAGITQNPQQLVAIVGGGDGSTGSPGRPDVARRGNAIYMLDLVSGALLWHAGPAFAGRADRGADLLLDGMTDAIAADVRVLDLSGTGFAERMYAVDTGGRIWRFDIHNGQPPATLVTGGVFAALGGGEDGRAASDARRFYHAPDVALLRDHGRLFLQLSVGSGAGGDPPLAGERSGAQVRHHFYGVRDYDLGPLPQTSDGRGGSASGVPAKRPAFVDATTDMAAVIPSGSPGWRITLGEGETVLGEARTFGGEIFFTTFTPHGSRLESGCAAQRGAIRLYVVNARNGGRPANRASKYTDLPASGLARHVEFVFPSPDTVANPRGIAASACPNGGASCSPSPVCLVGLVSCGALPAVPPVRTTWSQRGVAD